MDDNVHSTLTRLSFTFFSVPYAATWLQELSEHYEERTTIMTYRIALGWLVGVIFIFCMYSLMFTDSPEHSNGLLDPRHYAGFGLLLSILMMGWIGVTTLGTLNQVPYLPQYERPSSCSLGVTAQANLKRPA